MKETFVEVLRIFIKEIVSKGGQCIVAWEEKVICGERSLTKETFLELLHIFIKKDSFQGRTVHCGV